MAAAFRSSICVIVTLLLFVQHVDGQYCTRTLYRYTRRSVTAYRSRGSVYTYGCGFWGWGSCRGTRYHRNSYTAYNSVSSSYSACCSGYGGSNCHALCWGSSSCPNGGTCRAPNSCSCRAGWTGSQCTTDVNECSQRNTNRCHSNASCRNNRGSYTCYCNAGYQGSGVTCSDIDECRSNNGGCQHNCQNTVGSYRCSCRAGYRLSSNGHRCDDVNECSSNNGGCNHNCHNSVGSFTCSCNTGYQLSRNGHSCDDINECHTANGGCHHNCHNLIGSYLCTCNGGYDLNGDGHTCEVPPLPPTNLQVSSIGTRTATLTWQKPTISFQNSLTDVSSYQVTATQSQFSGLVNVVVTVSTSSYTFPHTLQEYTLYSCTVKARNAFGLGNASHSVEFRTLETAPSAPPQSVSGDVLSSTVLSFTWSPPPPVDINGIIQYYQVKLHETETLGNSTFYTNHPNINLGSLHPYYTYHFQVAARTTALGPFCEPVRLKTLETSPTAPPSNPYVTPNNSMSITFSWGLPPANKINGNIRRYVVEITEVETQSMSQYLSTSTEVTLQSLHPHYTYMCRVAAETVGVGPYTNNVTVQLPEDAPSEAPSNVTGHAVDSATIALMWDTIAPENLNGILRHYLVSILENETGGTMEYIANSTNITISSLHPHYIYICKVAGVTNMIGPSSQSIGISTPQDVPSGPPLRFSVVATTPRSLYFSWEPPRPEEQNGVIVGYVVNVTSDHSVEVLQLFSDLQATNISVGDLKPYTVYVCAVAAVTIPGVGPYSDEDTILMPEDVPTEPRNITLTRVVGSPTQLHIQWEKPEEPNGIIRAYTVYCRTNTFQGTGTAFNYGIHELVLDNKLQTLVDELTPFSVYECYVTANTSAGEGNPSVAPTAVTDESTPHDAPTSFSGLVLNSTAVFLKWFSPALPYGIIVSYTVTYNSSTNDITDIRIAGNETTNHTVQGLNEDTVYRFAVYASTRIGAGPSDEVTARTDEYYPHSPPSDVQIVNVGRREATIAWQLPVFEDQNGVIVYYQLIASQSQFDIPNIKLNINTTSHTLTNLEEHVEYVFMIAAATRIGIGPFSTPMNFTTLEDVPSEAPQLPSGVAHSPTLVTLTWSPPPLIDINGDLQYYVVKMTEVETGRFWKFFALDSFIRIGALHPYYQYRSQVAAHTIDAGPFTNPFYVQTLESAPTAPPSTPQVSELTTQSFSLTWQPPPFEATNGEIRHYTLSIVEEESEHKFEVTTNITRMTVDSLHPYYNYLCKVQAATVDSGPFSDTVSVHLLEAVPAGPPQNVSGFPISSTAATLSWRAPLFEDINGVIRHYTVNITELQTLNEFSLATTHLEIVLPSLHPYYTYECVVYAVTVGPGPGSAANITTLEEAPSGYPQNVAVTSVSSKSAHLTWQPPIPGEQNGVIVGYIVNITSTDGDGFEFYSASNQPTIDSLLPHRTYLLTVAAVTGAGIGPSSPAVRATTLEDAPSLAPQGVEVTAIDSRTILISWVPPPLEQQNGIIREYRVNINERETGNAVHLVTAATSVTVPSLHPFYTYNCTVAAFTVGEGPRSMDITIAMPEDVPSSGPVMFTVSNLTPTSAVFTWDAPPLEDRNGIIIGYSINVTKLQTGERQELFSNSTTITVYSLQPYTVYICTSTAITSVGRGPFSDATRFETFEARPETPPKNFTAHVITSRSASLSWLPPPREHHNGIIRHFWINITEMNTGRRFEKTLFSTSTVLSPLHPHYTYQFRVAAYTVSLGPFTKALVLQMPQDAPSSPPTNFSGIVLSSRSILLSWCTPPVEEQNGVIIGYNISTVELETEEVTELFTESYNLTLDSLQPYTTYGFHISARTVAGIGPATHLLFVRTHEEAPVGEVANLTAVFVGSTSINISWDHPPVDTHFGVIREYRINVTELETGAVFNLSTGSETTEITLESLHPFYTYTFVIVPVTVDVGTNSAEITIRTEEAAPSQPPVDIEVSAVHSRSAELAWAPPPMEHQNGIIRRYIVILASTDGPHELIMYSQETATLIDNLHPFKNYSYSVSAETVAAGPFSPAILFQTLEDAPTAPPEDLHAMPLDPRTLHITWKPPGEEDRNGIIRRFVINIAGLDTGTSLELESVNTTITVGYLHPFYRYSITVAAESIALGPATSNFITEMPEDVPSAPPNNITATNVTAFSLLLRWNPPPSEDQNGIIREYLINITEEDSGRDLQIRSLTAEIRVRFLHPHYTYTFTVAAWTTAAGPFSYPLQVVTATASPSSEPRNVSVVNITSTAIWFSWQPPHFKDQNGVITGYALNLTSLKTGVTQRIFTRSTTYTSDLISPHTVYTVAVAAETSAGRGPFSAAVSVQTLEDEPSASPVDISHTAVTSNSVDLSWSPPQSAYHNGIIRHYTVRVEVQDTGDEFMINATDEQITLGGLHPFYIYNISISAVTVSPGPYSEPHTVQTLPDVPTGSPEIISAEAIDPTTVHLSWNPPRSYDQNGIIVYYVINISSFHSPTRESFSQHCTTSSCNISDLHPYYTYECTVLAFTIGPGPYSEAYTFTTLEAAPDAPPQNVSAEVLNPNAVFLTWSPPPPDQQNGVVRHYHISQNETSTGILSNYTQEGNRTELFIGSLHAHYEYQFTIAAETVQLGPFSDLVAVTTLEDAPSGSPSNLTALVVNSTSIYLSWLLPVENQRNGNIRLFIIRAIEVHSGMDFHQKSTNNSVIYTGLHPAYIYNFTVAAVTVETGPYSDSAVATTLEDVPSDSPRLLQSVIVNSSSVLVTWLPPPPEHQNGIITAYIVNVSLEGSHTEHQLSTTSSLNLTLKGLRPFSAYIVVVAAETDIGRGPFSSPFEIHTPEDAPSSPPQDLRQVAIASTWVTLNWQPPPEDERNGHIRHYMVFFTELETGRSFTLNSTISNYRIENLHPFYIYTISIAAFTVATGPCSDSIHVQTLEDVPSGPPQHLVATNVTSRSIFLTWDPPALAEQNGIIQMYTINMTVVETGESVQLMSEFTDFHLRRLHPYYTYSFVISAVTTGRGPPSDVYNATTEEEAPGGPPQNMTADAISSKQILLLWKPPPSEAQNGLIRSYKIFMLEIQTNTSLTYEVKAEGKFQVESLHPYYDYDCSVAAVTTGPGPYTSPLSVRTFEDIPSGPPLGVATVVMGPRMIHFSWSPPFLGEQNGIIRSYIVNMTVAETGEHILLASNDTSLTAESLHPYYIYHFSVAAVTTGVGPFSAESIAQTSEDVPSGPPENVQVASISSTSIKITWDPPRPQDQNGIIQAYNITLTEAETGRLLNFQEEGTDSLIVVNFLHPYYTYKCSISAVTIGPGPAAYINVTTHQDVPKSGPQNISVTPQAATYAEINWNPPPLEDQNGMILSYSLIVSEMVSGGERELQTGNTSIVVRDLHPFSTYQIIIAAETIGLGNFSNPVPFQMPEASPGATVGNFTVEVISATSVELSWLPPDPQLWNGVITNYTVTYQLLGPVGITHTRITDAVSTMTVAVPTQGKQLQNNANPMLVTRPLQRETAVVEDLHEYNVYTFSVFIVNSAGRSQMSQFIIQEMPGAEPSAAPNAIQIRVLSSTSVEIQWQPPALLDQNGAITGYTVILSSVTVYNLSSNETRIHVDGLHKYAKYVVRIAAESEYGSGPLSNPVAFRSLEDYPGPPRNVTVSIRGGPAALLSWLQPEEPSGVITKYLVFYAGYETPGDPISNIHHVQPLDGPSSVMADPEILQAEILGIIEGLTYVFKVRARTSVGYGNFSSNVSAYIPRSSRTTVSTGVNETEDVEVDSEVQSRTDAAAATTFAVLGWLTVLGVLVVFTLALWYWYRKRHQRKYKAGHEMELAFRNRVTESQSSEDTFHSKASETTETDASILNSEDMKEKPESENTYTLAAADQGNTTSATAGEGNSNIDLKEAGM